MLAAAAAAAAADLYHNRTEPSLPPDTATEGHAPEVVEGTSAQPEIQSLCLGSVGRSVGRSSGQSIDQSNQ